MSATDSFFRFTLITLFLALFSCGFTFRLRANTSEKLDRLQEGWPILLGLRLSGLALWVVLIIWLVNPANLSWARLPIASSLRWAGLAAAATAVAWLAWMFRTLGANITDTVVTRQKAYLVTHGPYQYVRHPMYIGVLGLCCSLALITANWLVLALGVAVFTMMRIRLPIEERNLIARFGDDYRRYMQATGRFVPHSRLGRG